MKTQAMLIDEIKQISSQYHAEVGRGRKAWPQSIKDRVTELLKDGMKAPEVAAATGIAYFTVLRWRPEGSRGAPRGRYASKFKELPVVVAKNIGTVTGPQNLNQKVVTVTVTTPKGYQIKGTVDVVVEVLKSSGGLNVF